MSWLPNWLTGYDEDNAIRAAAADSELRRLNDEAIANGRYTQDQIDAIQRDYQTQEVFDPNLQTQSIDQAFVSGLDEGRNAVKSFFNGFVWQFLKSIPFVVWIGLAVALFVWLGGLSQLKGRFARK